MKGALGVALSVAVALAFAISLARAPASSADDVFQAMAVLRPAAPEPAPDIAFVALDGRPVRVTDLRGKPVLLGFFATW